MFKKLPDCFPKWSRRFAFLPAVCELQLRTFSRGQSFSSQPFEAAGSDISEALLCSSLTDSCPRTSGPPSWAPRLQAKHCPGSSRFKATSVLSSCQ